jgi:hypothetical protein
MKTPPTESADARFARGKTFRPPCGARCCDATDIAVRCQACTTQISWPFITFERAKMAVATIVNTHRRTARIEQQASCP